MKYELLQVPVICPACHFTQGDRLYRVDASQAAQHFIFREADKERNERLKKHIRSLWGADFCSVIRCNKCGLCFSYPFVAGDKNFYDLAYDRTRYPKWKWEFEITASTLIDLKKTVFLDTEVCLIEIGAGDGAFLKKIIAPPVNIKNVFATEYSSYGRETIGRMGIKCTDKNILLLNRDNLNPKFNVICMFQVLEHMDCLDDIFRKLSEISIPGAHFFFSVPNDSYIQFLEENDALLDMPPNHVTRWTLDSFVAIANRHNLELSDYVVQEKEKKITSFSRFSKFFFLRKSQIPYTIANIISSRIKHPIIKKGAQGLLAAFFALCHPKAYLELSRLNLSSTQWVHLKKKD